MFVLKSDFQSSCSSSSRCRSSSQLILFVSEEFPTKKKKNREWRIRRRPLFCWVSFGGDLGCWRGHLVRVTSDGFMTQQTFKQHRSFVQTAWSNISALNSPFCLFSLSPSRGWGLLQALVQIRGKLFEILQKGSRVWILRKLHGPYRGDINNSRPAHHIPHMWVTVREHKEWITSFLQRSGTRRRQGLPVRKLEIKRKLNILCLNHKGLESWWNWGGEGEASDGKWWYGALAEGRVSHCLSAPSPGDPRSPMERKTKHVPLLALEEFTF